MPRCLVQRTFPEGLAIPTTRRNHHLPVDRNTEVRVLDPYLYC